METLISAYAGSSKGSGCFERRQSPSSPPSMRHRAAERGPVAAGLNIHLSRSYQTKCPPS